MSPLLHSPLLEPCLPIGQNIRKANCYLTPYWFCYHEDGFKKLNACCSRISRMVYFSPEHRNLIIFTAHGYNTLFTSYIIPPPGRPLAPLTTLVLLTWRPSFFSHGDEYPSTLPWSVNNCPPFAFASLTLSHPTVQVTLFT